MFAVEDKVLINMKSGRWTGVVRAGPTRLCGTNWYIVTDDRWPNIPLLQTERDLTPQVTLASIIRSGLPTWTWASSNEIETVVESIANAIENNFELKHRSF